MRNTLIAGVAVAVLATLLGFGAAYTDYRYHFIGKTSLSGAGAAAADHPRRHPRPRHAGLPLAGSACSATLHSVDRQPCRRVPALRHGARSDFACRRWTRAWRPRPGTSAPANGARMREVILPFTLPAILAALFITMAVSFDEFAIAWFVSGFNETLPVRILAMLQGQVSPRINAIGSIVFVVSMTLVILAQACILVRRRAAEAAGAVTWRNVHGRGFLELIRLAKRLRRRRRGPRHRPRHRTRASSSPSWARAAAARPRR